MTKNPPKKTLSEIDERIYKSIFNGLSNLYIEPESQEYDACRFTLNDKRIICRTAKITPTKTGQFVTCWQRNAEGITAPFNHKDAFDFFAINVRTENTLGQFVFPKSILIEKGILITDKKDGKRGFRVYPPWDNATSLQAKKLNNGNSTISIR